MQILLVEDDYLQADAIKDELGKAFPGATIERIATESKFYEWIDGVGEARPDVIILDVMLRWTDPSPEMKKPPSRVREEGPWRAGFRCEQLLAASEKTRSIPTLLFTVLDRTDLQEDLENLRSGVVFLQKDSDLGPLVEEIREARRRARGGR